MKYRDLQIQTQREAPNNARTGGFAFLVRAGYVTRENVPTKFGEYAINHLREIGAAALQAIPTISNDRETFFAIPTGDIEIAHCANCKYTERIELARLMKPIRADGRPPLQMEKIETPDCNTIESLANFLNIQEEQTAKALMYIRISDGKFIFVVVRGDMQLGESKLKAQVGDVRAARAEEIVSVGAVAGYASAVGLRDAVIVVDDLIPQSPNLVAGANEAGFHLMNTNYGRDYSAEIVADLVQAKEGDACVNCRSPLSILSAIRLNDHFENILLALAETHHDEKGLTLPHPAAPFDVYLMHVPGKEIDTRAKAEEIYNALQDAGVSVLFDDRDERAGVKFNDADLIGCPVRVTVGEKGLKANAVEVKSRKSADNQSVEFGQLASAIKNML